jgi:hypothetical protein
MNDAIKRLKQEIDEFDRRIANELQRQASNNDL